MGKLYVSTDIGTKLQLLLNANPRFQFFVMKCNSPNGWSIWSMPRKRKWYQWRWSRAGRMGPPYDIKTSSDVMAAEMFISLEHSRFNVTYER